MSLKFITGADALTEEYPDNRHEVNPLLKVQCLMHGHMQQEEKLFKNVEEIGRALR